MLTLKFVSLFYETINLITEWFPEKGALLIDKAILFIAGNRFTARTTLAMDAKRLRRIEKFDKICVIADIHIGDAIMTQSLISGLRDFFPKAQIDYVASRSAEKLIAGNPEMSNLYPVYSDVKAPYPSESEIRMIGEILKKSDYDLVFNFCPFLSARKLGFPKKRIMGYLGFAAAVAGAEKNPPSRSHLVYRMHRHVHDLFDGFKTPVRTDEFKGNRLNLSAKSALQARKFLKDNGSDPNRKKIFLNPNASLPFTRIPFDVQVSLLKELSKLPCEILLGGGYKNPDIERRLLAALSEKERSDVKIVPAALPLDVYTAIMDLCDIFITGDTGPLHIASARKFFGSENTPGRNRTALLQIFGATPPRFYGYDSRTRGFFPANQDAPSFVYIAPSRCRNLTYMVKDYIAADERCFFDELDVQKIVSDVRALISAR